MLATVEKTEILESDLISEPAPHILATGKNVMIFNLKMTNKSIGLKTGKSFSFEQEIYEVMNVTTVQSKNDYLKLNCVRQYELGVL